MVSSRKCSTHFSFIYIFFNRIKKKKLISTVILFFQLIYSPYIFIRIDAKVNTRPEGCGLLQWRCELGATYHLHNYLHTPVQG